MLYISTELKTLLKTDYLPYRSEPAQKNLSFVFTDIELTIENNQVVADSFDLQESLNSSTDLEFGSCESAVLKVKFADVTENIKGKTFVLTQTVDNTEIQLGVFTVDSAIKEEDRRFLDITAYDNMRKFDKDVLEWYEALSFPISVKSMRQSLCVYCGVEYEDSNLSNDNMTVTKTVSSNTLNGLEVLRKLEQINGAFGHIGRDGKLQHKVLSKNIVDDTIPSGSYKSLKYEKYSTKQIDKVQILTEEGDIGAIVGTGTNCYKIQDNFLVYGKTAETLSTICTNLSTNILGITYVPYTCEMLGLPYLEVGDRVTFGDSITSYILTRNLKGIQSLKDNIQTQGSEEIAQVTSVNTEIRQLRGKTNKLTRDVENMESEISEFDRQINVLLPGEWYPDGSLLPCQNNMTNLEYEINSKIKQTASEITAEVNNVSEQLSTQINQTATSITAQVNNLSANMNAQFSITELEISSKVEKDGIISAINQSAESVTINASKINLNGYVTYTGLSDGTTIIDGSCLRTGTIDCTKVNVTNISADNINSGVLRGCTINGGIIDTGNITANWISAGVVEVPSDGRITKGGYNVLTRFDGTGYLNADLYSSSTYSGTYYIAFWNTNGDTNIPTIGWVKARQSSDERLKENFNVLDIEKEYMMLEPFEYRFKSGVNNNQVHFGFKANEIAKMFMPNQYDIVEFDTETITNGEKQYCKDGVYRINYDNMHAMHVYMIQKQQCEIQTLRKELNQCKELIQKYSN